MISLEGQLTGVPGRSGLYYQTAAHLPQQAVLTTRATLLDAAAREVISLFNDKVNIYEVHNNGNWYNFGFVFGLSIVFGSGSRASASARRPARSSR